MNRHNHHLQFQQLEMAAVDAAAAADAMLAVMAGAVNDNASSETGQRRKRTRAAEEEDVPDPRMQLTNEEREWALEIKQAMQDDDDILACAITDMEIAAYAIVDRGDIKRSLERAVCMQAFRMTYNINDNVEEALDILRRSDDYHPGCVLSIDTCPNDDGKGGHLMVVDMAQFNPYAVIEDGPKGLRVLMGAFYYMIMAMQPDIQSIRDGFRQVIECDGVGLKNVSYNLESKKWHELLSFIPMNRREVKVLRQPQVIAVLSGFLRPIMKKQNAEKYKYGMVELDIEYPDRIDNYYLQPTPEIALEALMIRIKQFMTQRYKNERSFRL